MSDPPTPDVSTPDRDAWHAWQRSPWGRLRYTLAEHNLLRHLAPPGTAALSVLDLAGGDGGDALRLAARGHHVTVVDRDPAMLAAARERVAEAGRADRLTLVAADLTALPDTVPPYAYDVVLCHNVLPYLDEPRTALATAVGRVRPGGLVSVMALNKHSAMLRTAVREQDPAAALAALDADRHRTELFGTDLRPYAAEDLLPLLAELGVRDVRHYGIRSVCDYLTDDARKHDPGYYAELERLELAVTDRPPYPSVARLFQLVGRTSTETGGAPAGGRRRP